MSERGVHVIIRILSGMVALVAVAGCATVPPPYVCQQAVTEEAQPVLVCQPVDKAQIVDRPAPARRGGVTPRDGA